MSWFSSKSHLWRCPLTRAYHDPAVLYRTLAGLGDITVEKLRGVFGAAPVTHLGSGFSEAQVLDAYDRFCEWVETKKAPGSALPTSAPSTASPPA